MDPLSLPLSCTCVEGVGQRRYDQLGKYLESRLQRPVKVVHEEGLGIALKRLGAPAHVVIGKEAVVRFDAKNEKILVRPLVSLTGKKGGTDLAGVFLVRKDSPFQSLADLEGKKIALGPVEQEDTHGAARAALKKAGLLEKVTLETAGSIDSGALALTDGEVDCAVVSEFMPVLLEGCGKIEKGSVRVLATTPGVPFISAFATSEIDPEDEAVIRDAFLAMAEDEATLAVMESAAGFKAAAPKPSSSSEGWTDWRGEDRKGYSPHIPQQLPEKPVEIWSAKLTGPAMAGIAATEKFVVVPDKDTALKRDVFRCFDAATGDEIWALDYEASEKLDYSNAPRATPVIVGDLVYLQGALGDLHCVKLASGEIVWQKNIYLDFGAELLPWGSSVPPLIVGDLLVTNPGGPEASLVGLDRKTGEVKWKSPGHAAAYASFITASPKGKAQIIGYDCASLGGWDLETGERLWEFVPPDDSDFNVTTPLLEDGKLYLATENNGARVHAFDDEGKLIPEPLAENEDLAPDTCTPVLAGGKLYATAYGELYCLDLEDGLKTLWHQQNDMFFDHSNVMAGDNRVLVWAMSGDLLLIDASPGVKELNILRQWKPFGEGMLDSMSHPAIMPGRIYLRSKDKLLCLKLEK